MITVEWEIFTWVMGIVLGLTGILFWRYFDSTIKDLNEDLRFQKERVDNMEQCNTEMRVSMAKIETTLEDIKNRQAEMQIDIRKMITRKK
jgi:predicted  nucleic acid-binding Zn-ribbon protein